MNEKNFFNKIDVNIKLGEKFSSYNASYNHYTKMYEIRVYDRTSPDGHLLFRYDSINDLFEMNYNKYTEEQILKVLNLLAFV